MKFLKFIVLIFLSLLSQITIVIVAQAVEAQPADTKAAATSAAPTLEAISYLNDSYFTQSFDYSWGRDPFIKSPGFTEPSSSESIYKLSALIYSPDNPQAIINGKIVKEGSRLEDGFKIEKIGTNFVVISKGTSTKQLTIQNRKPAASTETK